MYVTKQKRSKTIKDFIDRAPASLLSNYCNDITMAVQILRKNIF